MKVMAVIAFFGLFFVIVEIITVKTGLSKELSRKSVHISSGVTAAFLPYVLSFTQIVYISLFFIPVMLISKRTNLLSSIHSVKRKTLGEVYFPMAILATALLFPEKQLFIYGLLVMAVSDGLASIIGQKYGLRKFNIAGTKKSYAGSGVFLASAFVIGMAVLLAFGTAFVPALSISLMLACLLCAIEASLGRGFDNLVLPPAAAGLMLAATSLFGLR